MAIKLICLDFVGTVATFSPDVVTTYHAFGKKFGSELSLEQVRVKYELAFEQAFRPTVDEPVDQQWSVDAWKHVVRGAITDVVDPDGPLFDALWEHFASVDAWSWCRDIEKVAPLIKSNGYTMAVASNFDNRLERLLLEPGPLAIADFVFHSAGLGWNKPNLNFFRAIEDATDMQPHEIVMVGDGLTNDIEPALEAGWQAVWCVDEIRDDVEIDVPQIRSMTELLGVLS